MGSDDLFRKNRARSPSSFRRRAPIRAPYDKVLIVCEGSKTEPQYFEGLRHYYGLSNTNILVTGECGTDPKGILAHAKKVYEQAKRLSDPFDRVYCVFDRDSHLSFYQTVSNIDALKPRSVFFGAYSIPSFEYWLLLHFKYSNSPYVKTGNKSAGDCVIDDLRTFMPTYQKSRIDVFEELVGQLDTAINYSKRILETAKREGSDNPSTNIHDLVEYLRGLKSD